MALSWIAGRRTHDVNYFILHKQYDKAIELVRGQLSRDRDNVFLRQTLADALVNTGKVDEATAILHRLADDFAEAGFVAKATAILKKIDRVAPGRTDVYEKLAEMTPHKVREEEQRRQRRTSPTKVAEPPKPPAVPEGEIEFELEEPAPEPRMITTPLFQSLTPEELVPLLKGFELLTFEPGDVIVAQGEQDSRLFILTSGRVKAWVRNAVGHFNKVREMRDVDFFGEISVITGEPRTATITAATQCELLMLDKSKVDEIAEKYPNVREVMLAFASERLDSAEEMKARGADEQDGSGIES